jgi:von Willebrand factor A domain-containing protein 8
MQSGDDPEISLVTADKPPNDLLSRWKVVEKMNLVPQYAFAGDFTGLFKAALSLFHS